LERYKISVILNEREFAEAALEKYTLENKPLETLSRVARYYSNRGYKRTDICLLLETFLVKCDPTINLVKWQDTINKQAKDASKYSLIEIEDIPITQKELDICDRLNGAQIRRLMFTLICLAKFSNTVNKKNNGWVNRQDKEIFKMANIITSVKRQSLMLNDLRELGLIRFSRKVDNININVRRVDGAGRPVLHISDFRNLGHQYLRYCGGQYLECASCGLVIKRTSNSQKYCNDCAVETNRQKTRNHWKSKPI
jgi:hypothetical protein